MIDPEELLRNPPLDFLPYLHFLLLVKSSDKVLKELLSILGQSEISQFLNKFGGQTVTFPSWKSVENTVKDSYLFYRINKLRTKSGNISNHAKKALEKEFGIKYDHLLSRASSVGSLLGLPKG